MCFCAQHDVTVDLCAVQSSGAQQGVPGLVVQSSYSRANNGEAVAGALGTKGMKWDPSTKWWQSKCVSAIHHGSFWSLTHFKSSRKTLGKRADSLLVSNRYIKNWVAKKGLTTALCWNSEKSKCLGFVSVASECIWFMQPNLHCTCHYTFDLCFIKQNSKLYVGELIWTSNEK